MKPKELVKRYTLFVISLFLMGLGIGLSKYVGLGVTPISSVANVLNIKWPELSMGTWLLIWNCTHVVAQIIILRKDFQLIQLLQIPLSVLFGWFTDFGLWLVHFIPIPHYAVRLALVFVSILIHSMGVALSVIANVVMNSGEGLVKAIADKWHFVFGNVKIGFDVGCVIVSIIFSLIFLNGQILGVREGTVIIALVTGHVVKFYQKHLSSPLNKALSA